MPFHFILSGPIHRDWVESVISGAYGGMTGNLSKVEVQTSLPLANGLEFGK